jgi:hypothetical protein
MDMQPQQSKLTTIDPHNVMLTFANGPISVTSMPGAKLITFTQIIPRIDDGGPGIRQAELNAVVVCRVILADAMIHDLIRMMSQHAVVATPPAGSA